MKINHPLVVESTQTCIAYPEQYEGRLKDSRYFYFRYRFGNASLAIATTREEADGRHHADLKWGDPLQGQFQSQRVRDAVFAVLMSKLLHTPSQDED